MLNKTIKNSIKLGISSLLLASSLSYATQGHINIASKAQKVVISINAQGQEEQTLVPISKVLPGEIVQYSNIFENISNKTASDIGVTNPIPENMVYVPHSAQGDDCYITFSIDGGKRWGQPYQLKVRNKQGKLVQAKAEDYTHIHWQYRGKLKANEKRTVSFKTILL